MPFRGPPGPAATSCGNRPVRRANPTRCMTRAYWTEFRRSIDPLDGPARVLPGGSVKPATTIASRLAACSPVRATLRPTKAGRRPAQSGSRINPLFGIASEVPGSSPAGPPRIALLPIDRGRKWTGKEVAARIRQLSPAKNRRSCNVNGAAILEDLLDSELFGHARGAFTGAVAVPASSKRPTAGRWSSTRSRTCRCAGRRSCWGSCEQHEVRQMENLQPQSGRAAGGRSQPRDAGEAGGGRFRQDLLTRLDVIRLQVLPLRKRLEDVAVLAEYFWRDASARI